MIVNIEKVVFGGKGLAKVDGKACFVPYVLPEEQVEISIEKDKKTFCEASLKKVLKESPYRRNPPCKYYTVCGGCDFQHIVYEKQIELKKQALQETLLRIAKEEINIDKVVPSKEEFFYRNKAQFKTDGVSFGFFKASSNEVVDIERCEIVNEDINESIPMLRDLKETLKTLKEVHMFTVSNQKALLKFVVEEFEDVNFENLKQKLPVDLEGLGVYKGKKRIKLYGNPFVFEKAGKFTFRISIDSFFQVNRFQIENFINEVLEEIPEDKNLTVGDIFCGVGTLSIPVSKKVKKVFGIEISKSAVKDAKYNAKINNASNTNFYEVSADRAGDLIYGHNPDILIFDPPRTGLAKRLIDKVLKLKKLKKIVYVSCNPSTLARDINLLKEGGFKLSKVKMIDMFPQTHHIEAIAVLDRI